MSDYLTVRAGTRWMGLPLLSVVEVVTVETVLPAPARHHALRGVVPIRDRLLPLIHLGAFVSGEELGEYSTTAVVVTEGVLSIALEVDEADDVVRDAPDPARNDADVSWTLGLATAGDRVMPIIDIAALVDRLRETGVEGPT